MDISIKVANRELSPAVCNFFQYENQTVTLKFTLDSYKYGEVDLRNYKAYGVTSQNGMVDMTELVSTYDSAKDELTLTWEVQEYSLRQVGPITYQICFKENADDGENTAVFYSYKGIMINRGSIDGDNHITANYPTILKQWLDRINSLASMYNAGIIYMDMGNSIPAAERLEGRLYYQFTNAEKTKGYFEDHTGKVLSELESDKTNCITHIPQDINLTLKDGILTLKAGSKAYFPNGSGVFDEFVISEDKTATITNNNEYFLICTNSGSVSWAAVNTATSGSSVPTDKSGLFYNTTNNTVRFYTEGVSSGVVFSLPIALVTVSDGVCTSIDQVFNGFGYIGSTIFALPGVKGLSPNGRYADGTLNNVEFETKYVRTRTFADTENKQDVCLLFNGDSFARIEKDIYVYDEVKNENVDGVYNYVSAHIGSLDITAGVVSDFNVKVPFRAVDWFDLNALDNEVLHKAGAETITGPKINTSQWQARCTFNSAQLPASNKFENNYVSIDANNELVGYGGMQYLTNGLLSNRMGVHRVVNGEDKFGAILVGLDKDGNPITEAPTPAEDDNSTQIATTEWVRAHSGGLPLFTHIWSDHIINEISYLRADTFSWHSGDVYVSGYEHLVADISGVTAETETIGSTTITFYRATDGHKIVLADQADNVAAIYAETGIAWYYVLDTENNRFKLPRTKHAFTGLRDSVGNYVEAGLPNITGSLGNFASPETSDTSIGADGAFNTFSLGKSGTSYNGTTYPPYKLKATFDASLSSEVYGKSDTAQPPATQMYLYFFVGNKILNETSVNVGTLTESVNAKADLDLANLTDTGKAVIPSLAMAGTKSIDLTMAASGSTYTAPADGYINIIGDTTSTNASVIFTQGQKRVMQIIPASNWTNASFWCQVRKGDFTILYTNITIASAKFFYAEGAE